MGKYIRDLTNRDEPEAVGCTTITLGTHGCL